MYIAFWVWLLSLGVMLLRSIHVAYIVGVLFLLTAGESFTHVTTLAQSVYSNLLCILVELSSIIEL